MIVLLNKMHRAQSCEWLLRLDRITENPELDGTHKIIEVQLLLHCGGLIVFLKFFSSWRGIFHPWRGKKNTLNPKMFQSLLREFNPGGHHPFPFFLFPSSARGKDTMSERKAENALERSRGLLPAGRAPGTVQPWHGAASAGTDLARGLLLCVPITF